MRLQTLELIRYGRFSGQTLHFPRGACDFHLVVGPNEAGKSTLRRAVGELLFGMPLRSEMDFVHPLAELRLGAVVESDAGTLAFHRTRSRKAPLRRPDDSPLPDAALAAHLGSASAALFQRMFCLDLAALLEGGQSILDASDDVGQLLFQSAAGLAGLGAVRDALADEANRLYAPRRSGDRAFYQGLDQLQAARQALKGLTVNARQYAEARARVEELQARQREAEAAYRTLSAERQQLERVRRTAPRLAQWRDVQAQRAALDGSVVFPDDAARRLNDAELTIAAQAATLQLHRDAAAAWRAQAGALAPDEAVLAAGAAIEALAARQLACLQHRPKLAAAEQELQALLREAAADAASLRWPQDEAALRARVPTPLALKALAGLMEERGALLQALQSAQQNEARAAAALARLQPQAAPAVPTPAPTLAAALQEAQALKAGAARQRTLQAALAQAEAQLEAALRALAGGRRPLPALAAMAVPAEEQLAALKAGRAALAAALDAARQQAAQAAEQARASALELEQFAAGHDAVTLDEVRQARAARDGLWQRIRGGQTTLADGAAPFEQALGEADRLVDHQRDHATASATLLSLRQAQARDAAAAAARADALVQAQQALDGFDARWAAQADAIGLPGMALLDLSGWLLQRRAALDAAALRDLRAAELQAEQAAEAAAAAALQAALQASGAPADAEASLAARCAQAESLLAAHQAARSAAESLARQRADAQQELAHQQQALQASERALQGWQARWQAAVKAAALDGDWLLPDAARAAVELATQVLARLAQVDEVRGRRIAVLQRELAEVAEAAAALPPALGTPPAAEALAAWIPALVQRLQQAREQQQARTRLLKDLQAAEAEARAAETSLAATRASLASLCTLAGSDVLAVVRARIADSDRRRALEAELQQHRAAVVEQGDGLAFDALAAEADAVPPETLKPRLDALEQALAAAVERQAQGAAALAEATAALERVDGGPAAAEAESKRLEALAQLGDAAQRYVTVATGHRLLRWAIDRYRERRQGPLLQRASALFARLTLGGFSRLVPDFEVTPPKLLAIRAGGERVGVGGLSEGTRDQLFLALRLAALEMHVAGDRPLPFIADDLFVNFHDSRSRAGLAALGELARHTQVVFLTHHEHLVDVARECIGAGLNVIALDTLPAG